MPLGISDRNSSNPISSINVVGFVQYNIVQYHLFLILFHLSVLVGGNIEGRD